MKQSASEWLANLPLHKCPTCSNETIFKSGCNDCEEKASLEIEKTDIANRLVEIENEIESLQNEKLVLTARQNEILD